MIGRLSLDRIKISHIVAIIERAEQADAPEAGRRVRARVERVINAAIALSGEALRNPADGKLIAAAHPMRRKGDRPHLAVKLDRAPEVFRTLERRGSRGVRGVALYNSDRRETVGGARCNGAKSTLTNACGQSRPQG